MLGFVIGADDRFEIGNIVNLMEAGNKDHGFRYFNLNSASKPDLGWVRELVQELIVAVTRELQSRGQYNALPGPASKFNVIIGKPRPKDL